MLTPKEQRRLKRYEEDLSDPKWKFILGYGLTWGITMFVLLKLTDYLFYKQSVQWDYRLLLSFLLAAVLGIIFGWVMRWFAVRDFKRLKEKAD